MYKFIGMALTLGAAVAMGTPHPDARFSVDATTAEQVTVAGFGVEGVKVGGTATLPAPGTGTTWWVEFTVSDMDDYPIEDYGVTVADPYTQTYGWPAAGTFNWQKTLHCVDANADEVDWPSGWWVITCRLYATIGVVPVHVATDTILVAVE